MKGTIINRYLGGGKIAVVSIIYSAVIACESNLSEVETRLDDLETWVSQQELKDSQRDSIKPPQLLQMKITAEKNPAYLTSSIVGEIIGDSVVECWIPNVVSDKELITDFDFEGDRLEVEGHLVQSGVTRLDYRKPIVINVLSKKGSHGYTVYVHSFTGLPVLWVETAERKAITTKTDYIRAEMRLVEDVRTRSAGDIIIDSVNIRGRGNTTWSQSPKKPYRLKFDSKIALLDEPADKSWVLLANYSDHTMLRNQVAFYMGELSALNYTPRFHFVELFLNGRYNGTYQLGDKIKISKNRLNIGDNGFLLEIDHWASSQADEIKFSVPHLKVPVVIKDPDLEVGDEQFNYVKDFITTVDKALFSDNFADPDEGWQKYMDIDSFVDWYLINEISRNNDGWLWSSCYMNFKRGEKLKMGPIWDYDLAFGNYSANGNYATDGFWIKTASWYQQLFKDPVFVQKVKERFAFFYSHKEDILNDINMNALYLEKSIVENDNRWKTLYTNPMWSYDVWGSYQNEVQWLKQWIYRRFEWLKSEFDNMD